LSPLPSGYPCWTPYTTESTGMNDWKAVCLETGTYSLVGGRWKRADSVPRQRPTQLGPLAHSDLACLLVQQKCFCWKRCSSISRRKGSSSGSLVNSHFLPLGCQQDIALVLQKLWRKQTEYGVIFLDQFRLPPQTAWRSTRPGLSHLL
jgi:hypothetical protein